MSYKVFTNASPLPASDLNTFLMNQSVITFANATERDATLTAPTEGMVVYLENNNHLQIRIDGSWVTQNPINAQGDLIIGNASGNPSRLAVGTDGSIPRVASGTLSYLAPGTSGQVLTISGGVPTWTSPAAAGGASVVWSLLGTVNLASTPTSSVAFTGISNRKKLLLEFNNATFNGGSTSSWWGVQINGSSSTVNPPVGLEGLNSSPWVRPSDLSNGLAMSIVSSGSNNGFGTVLIHDAELSTNSQVDVNTGVQGGAQPNSTWRTYSTIVAKSAPITTVQVFTSWGNNFTSGTMRLWGGA